MNRWNRGDRHLWNHDRRWIPHASYIDDMRDHQRLDRREAPGAERRPDPGQTLPSGAVRAAPTEKAPALPAHDRDGRLRGGSPLPDEFQVGEDVIGQHRPLWARGAAVDEHDHDLLQIEIVGFSKLDRWLPKPSSLSPLVALLALLHRRGFVVTALRRPTRWPVPLDRLPAAVDTYYRRLEVWDHAFVYGHVEIPGDEHWDPGSLDHPVLFPMVRDVLAPKEVDGEMLSDSQLEGIHFANGMRRYLDSPENEPAEPGRTVRASGSRSGSPRTSRVSPRQRRSNLADPRPKAAAVTRREAPRTAGGDPEPRGQRRVL